MPARSRLAVDVASEQVRPSVARAELAGLAEYVLRAEGVRDAMLSVALVSPRAIAKLNREHLGHKGPTDVIAFGLRPDTGSPRLSGVALRSAILGDIYICPTVARTNAVEHGVSVRDEVRRLVVHGTLHVLGWTHPENGDRAMSPMWARQERLLREWNRRAVKR